MSAPRRIKVFTDYMEASRATLKLPRGGFVTEVAVGGFAAIGLAVPGKPRLVVLEDGIGPYEGAEWPSEAPSLVDSRLFVPAEFPRQWRGCGL